MDETIADSRRYEALGEVIRAASAGSAKFLLVGSALLAAASLIPGLNLPPELAVLAGGIGVNALETLLDRIASGEDLSQEEIVETLSFELEKLGINELLTKDEFYHAFSHQLNRQRVTHDQNEEILQVLRELQAALAGWPQLLEAASVVDESKLDREAYFRWIAATESATPLVTALTEEENVAPRILNYALNVEPTTAVEPTVGQPLWRVTEKHNRVVLVGEPGAGKTVCLWQLALQLTQRQEENDALPVYYDLTTYRGESLPHLLRNALRASGQPITLNEAERILDRNETLALLLDDFDTVPREHQRSLIIELKSWLETHPDNCLVITAQAPIIGRQLQAPTYRLQPLKQEQIKQILAGLGLQERDVLAIIEGFSAESLPLISNPLTLRMVAYAYNQVGGRKIPRSRGLLYREIAEGMIYRQEGKHWTLFDWSDVDALLQLLACWMQNNGVYSITPAKLGGLLYSWTHDAESSPVKHLGGANHVELRNTLLNSGFLHSIATGEIGFIHSTFRAYFAALSLELNVVKEVVTSEQWRQSVLFWASLSDRSQSDALVELAEGDWLLLGSIIRERSGLRSDEGLENKEPPDSEHYSEYYRKMLHDFPLITSLAYPDTPEPPMMHVFWAQSEHGGYLVTAQADRLEDNEAAKNLSPAQLLNKVTRLASRGIYAFPILLLPRDIAQKYHPLEVAYLFLMRSLFETLNFMAVNGGFEENNSIVQHPGVARLLNRYYLHLSLAGGLPRQLQNRLPAFLVRPFDVAVEVHTYGQSPFVRSAFIDPRDPGTISVIVAMIEDEQKLEEERMFKEFDGGRWELKLGGNLKPLASSVEEASLEALFRESPGNWAEKQIDSFLERELPGYPPEGW